MCLCVPCEDDAFSLECDASATGIGAVLSVQRVEEWRPVAFFSRQLKGAQARYSAQELEGLALFEAVNHFAFYLYGKVFKVFSDHKGLQWLTSGKQRNRRVYGWALKLTEFQFEVIYRPGTLNVVADELSRCHGDDERRDTRLSKEEGGDVGQPTFVSSMEEESKQRDRGKRSEGRRRTETIELCLCCASFRVFVCRVVECVVICAQVTCRYFV